MVEERTETTSPASRAAHVLDPADVPVPLASIDPVGFFPVSTGVAELDRVLGGGLVPGSATVLGGEPGVGKSTLLLQVAIQAATAGRTVLYVSAEESPQQLRHRAQRMGVLPEQLHVSAAIEAGAIEAAVTASEADLVIVDSIQTVHDAELTSAPGSVGQVRACAARLVQLAKRTDLALLLVGHVTKEEGALAGPRVLEHLVDTVLSFDGDRHGSLRLLRATKHRFGPTGELGVLAMTERGLEQVADASGMFLEDRLAGVPGSVVLPTIEGARPLLVEVQALVAETPAPSPRRSAQGIDGGRLAVLLGVLTNRLGLAFGQRDVFASVVGGVRVQEPAIDLALALALISAATDTPLPPGVVAMGEVGLGGEVRQVTRLDTRLAEAERLGFDHALVPAGSNIESTNLIVHRITSVAESLETLGLAKVLRGGP